MASPCQREASRRGTACRTFDAVAALAAIEAVVGNAPRPVALHEPHFGGREWDYVKETLDSGWVSSVGRYVDEFERRLAERCEVPHAVATVNGTAALHACLLLVGVQPGDEVLMPALTFIATANAVSYCGAIPHFCDSDPRSLGIDPEKLDRGLAETAEMVQGACRNRRTGRRIAAIVPMHTFGHPVDMDALAEVAARWRIPIVEDAAEALGSSYKGRHVGEPRRGRGAELQRQQARHHRRRRRDPDHRSRARARRQAPDDDGEDAAPVGVLARPGRLQLPASQYQCGARLRAARAARCVSSRPSAGLRRAIATRSRDVAGATIFVDADYATSNYWLVTMMLDTADEATRDAFLAACHARGVLCRPVWTGMHRLPMFKDCPRMDLAEAEALEVADRQSAVLDVSRRLGRASQP